MGLDMDDGIALIGVNWNMNIIRRLPFSIYEIVLVNYNHSITNRDAVSGNVLNKSIH